jgi:flagellar hook-associated protein 1 FlgK
MSLLSILHTGAQGLQTAQLGTQVAGNNVSNVSTEGYVRRSTHVQPGATIQDQPAGRRVVDQFVEKRLLGAHSSAGDAAAHHTALVGLDNALAESEHGLGSALDAFHASMQDLAAQPSEEAYRAAALAKASELAYAFQNTAQSFDHARTDANARVADEVKAVNSRLVQIGDLNKRISKAEVDGSEASDLRDQRDTMVREVADRVPVSVVEGDNSGGISLLLNGGQALITPEGQVNQLMLTYASNGDVGVTKSASGVTVDVTDALTSGSIGGYLRARDGGIADARESLDQLAYDIAASYNDLHTAGIGLDGVGGRGLFDPIAAVDGAANAFELSNDVAGHPERLATAQTADQLPSDNRNALAMANLASAPIALGGMSVVEALASLTSSVGFAVQSAAHGESFANDAMTQIQSLHDNVSAVSSDEEMVHMMAYQRSYQASLKVVQTADEMLGELMNLRR